MTKIIMLISLAILVTGCTMFWTENYEEIIDQLNKISLINKDKAKTEAPEFIDDREPPKAVEDWAVISDLVMAGRGHEVIFDCAGIRNTPNGSGQVNGNMWCYSFTKKKWFTWDYTRQGGERRHFPWYIDDPTHKDYKISKDTGWPRKNVDPFCVMWSGLIRDSRRNQPVRSRVVYYEK